MTDKALTMIDLFAGAGGLSEGLSEAGFHSLFASEIVPAYADTYKKNHPFSDVLTADIRTVDADEIREKLGMEKGELDLLAGGPPCQGFSINAPVRSFPFPKASLYQGMLKGKILPGYACHDLRGFHSPRKRAGQYLVN